MQEMTGKYQTKVIYFYRIAGQRTGEMNHVGGLIRTTIHPEIDAEKGMAYTTKMVNYPYKSLDTNYIQNISLKKSQVAILKRRKNM